MTPENFARRSPKHLEGANGADDARQLLQHPPLRAWAQKTIPKFSRRRFGKNLKAANGLRPWEVPFPLWLPLCQKVVGSTHFCFIPYLPASLLGFSRGRATRRVPQYKLVGCGLPPHLVLCTPNYGFRTPM